MSKVYLTLDDFEAWELEAFVDGEALHHVAAFVAQHEQQWAHWLAQNRQDLPLTAALFRFDCPTPDRLRDYLWQHLSGRVIAQVEAHLTICPHCSAELATLRQLVMTTASEAAQAPAPQPIVSSPMPQWLQDWWQNATDRFHIAVAQLVTPLAPTATMQALRTGGTVLATDTDTTSLLLYETDGVDISLMVARRAAQGCQIAGQLYTAAASPTGSFQLWSTTEPEPVSAGAIDENGTFQITGLATGDYQLIVQLATQIVVIPTLRM